MDLKIFGTKCSESGFRSHKRRLGFQPSELKIRIRDFRPLNSGSSIEFSTSENERSGLGFQSFKLGIGYSTPERKVRTQISKPLSEFGFSTFPKPEKPVIVGLALGVLDGRGDNVELGVHPWEDVLPADDNMFVPV